MKRIIKLTGDAARRAAHREIDAAQDGYFVQVGEATRTLEQNARLHCMLTDISNQQKYLGKKRSIPAWKGIFVSGWQIAVGEIPEILPGLEGEFINIRESTTSISGKRMSSLMEYITAWAIQNGVKWSPITVKSFEGRR